MERLFHRKRKAIAVNRLRGHREAQSLDGLQCLGLALQAQVDRVAVVGLSPA
jgi:hypothetical protein